MPARWAHAGEALDQYPALGLARERLSEALRAGDGTTGRVVGAVEADPALTLRILTAANRRRPGSPVVGSVPRAVDLLGRDEMLALAQAAPVVDPFTPSRRWERLPERMRVRSLMAHRACWRLAAALGREPCDELAAAALLHHVGQFAMQVLVGTPGDDDPEAERAEWGIDHAQLGAHALRLRRFPESLAAAVEHHHDRDIDGDAAVIRLAAMLARYGCGQTVSLEQMASASRALGIHRETLGAVIYDLTYPLDATRPALQKCPLSERELEVLTRLAEGQLYKQIAQGLGLSPSTVRSHLHRIYRRLGAVDRTQAILIAIQFGWIRDLTP